LLKFIRKILKTLAGISPVALTKNELYDRLTNTIIKQHCKHNSVCIDVGSHDGKILQMMLKAAPHAIHYAFEPIESLITRSLGKHHFDVNVYNVALSNKKGIEHFNLVTSNTAYSGLKKDFTIKRNRYYHYRTNRFTG